MYKKIIILLIVAGVLGLFVWRMRPVPVATTPTIIATFYPLAYFATQVGSQNFSVISLTPPGIEPHEYEPTPQDLVKIESAAVVIINGGGIDVWAERLAPTWRAQGKKVIILNDQADPHSWLDPVIAQKEIAAIAETLTAADPTHAAEYQERAKAYQTKLEQLHQEYVAGLAQCATRDLVVSHDAYHYLTTRYNLNLLPIAGLSPDAEPSAKQLADLTEKIKAKDIKYIFFESLTSPKLAETLARETGARTLVLNPIEGLTAEDQAAGKNYDILMRENLQNLRMALVCQ